MRLNIFHVPLCSDFILPTRYKFHTETIIHTNHSCASLCIYDKKYTSNLDYFPSNITEGQMPFFLFKGSSLSIFGRHQTNIWLVMSPCVEHKHIIELTFLWRKFLRDQGKLLHSGSNNLIRVHMKISKSVCAWGLGHKF